MLFSAVKGERSFPSRQYWRRFIKMAGAEFFRILHQRSRFLFPVRIAEPIDKSWCGQHSHRIWPESPSAHDS